MKKWFVLILSFALLLTGCVQNAPFVADALKKSFHTASYEATSTFILDTNLPVEDKDVREFLQILKSGVNVQIEQSNERNAHLRLSLVDPKPILGTTLWPQKVKPSFDLYVQGNDTFFKSSVDRKYLSIPAENSMTPYGLNALPQKLMEDYLVETKFNLKNAGIMGKKTIILPNGKKENTTHVRLFFELDEALDWLSYTLQYMSNHPELETQFNSLSSNMPSGEIDGNSLKQTLMDMAAELKALDVNQLKKDGWDFNLILEFWINSDKHIVQSNSTALMKMPASVFYDMGIITKAGYKSIYFKVNSKDQYWNQNKKVVYSLPKKNQIIPFDQLMENPQSIDNFSTGSPIRTLGESVLLPME